MDTIGMLWPTFHQPWALLLTPALWLLIYLLQRYSRRVQQWEQLLPQVFHPMLLSQVQHDSRRWPALLLGLASLCLGLALSQPYWSVKQEHITEDQFAPLVFVIQLTPESLATDLAPNRLQRIQHKVMQLVNAHEQTKTAIVVYAGSAHTLVPLSNDTAAIHNLLYALHPSLMPVAGQNAALAIERASQLLEQSGQPYGQILLFSYGLSAPEQQALSQYVRHSKHRLSILGVGSTQGAPITDAQTGRLMTDAQGNILISQLDELDLQRFSQQHNIAYARLTQNSEDIEQLHLTLNSQRHAAQTRAALQNNQGFWFLLPLLWLLAPMARRGWLLTLLCACLLTPHTSLAHNDSTARLLERIQADPERALAEFNDPMWRGIAAYHGQNYPLAIEHFSLVNSAEAAYNRGNAHMQLEEYTQAVFSYEYALELNPALTEAADNLQLAHRLLGQQSKALQHNAEETNEAAPDTQANPSLVIQAPLGLAQQQALEQQQITHDSPAPDIEAWLNQIPDNPGELLRRKFWHEHFGTGAP